MFLLFSAAWSPLFIEDLDLKNDKFGTFGRQIWDLRTTNLGPSDDKFGTFGRQIWDPNDKFGTLKRLVFFVVVFKFYIALLHQIFITLWII